MQHIPPEGLYRKHDGLTFAIRHIHGANADDVQPVLELDGRLHCLEPRKEPAAPDSVEYNLAWKFGSATMRYERRFRCFVENGAIRFFHESVRNTREAPVRTTFNEWERRHLHDCGYLIVPDGTSEEQVRLALEDDAVKTLIAEASADGVLGSRWKSGSSTATGVVTLLTGLWPAIEALFGCAVPPPTHAQVAVVGLERESPHAQPLGASQLSPGYHIDGLHAPGNGVPPGEVRNFNLLVGVALTDVLVPNSGNFGVVPYSHHALIRALKEHPRGCDALRILVGESVKATMDGLLGNPCEARTLCSPHVLCMPRGTVYICQYALSHFVHPNCSPRSEGPRVAVYFRLTSPNRPPGHHFRPESLLQPTLELPGLLESSL